MANDIAARSRKTSIAIARLTGTKTARDRKEERQSQGKAGNKNGAQTRDIWEEGKGIEIEM